jgi:hypothetical protein
MGSTAVPYDQMRPGLEGPALRKIPYALMDLLVIAACCMVFAAVIGAGKPMAPKAVSNALIAPNPGAAAPQAVGRRSQEIGRDGVGYLHRAAGLGPGIAST